MMLTAAMRLVTPQYSLGVSRKAWQVCMTCATKYQYYNIKNAISVLLYKNKNLSLYLSKQTTKGNSNPVQVVLPLMRMRYIYIIQIIYHTIILIYINSNFLLTLFRSVRFCECLNEKQNTFHVDFRNYRIP